MRSPRITLAAVATFTVVGIATPALAAPPSNDVYAGRVAVGSVPFNTSQDTREATTDADDAEINICGAPAMDASVWYEVTSTEETNLVADVSASSYSAGVFVAAGSPGSFQVVACGPVAVGWLAEAGTAYSVLIIDDQGDGGGNGGDMELTIAEAPPTPEVDVTVDPRGQFTRTGSALLTGTVACSGDADFAFLDVELTQTVGRFKIIGFGGTDLTCDGTTRPWSLEIVADNGTFAGGKAASVTFAVACGAFDCGVDFEERLVRLSGKKR